MSTPSHMLPAFENRLPAAEELVASLWIGRVVEQHCQLDATVPELREVELSRLARIEIGCGIVRWK